MKFKKTKVYYFDCNACINKLEVIGKKIKLNKRKKIANKGKILFNEFYKKNKKNKLKKKVHFIVCANRFLPPINNSPTVHQL